MKVMQSSNASSPFILADHKHHQAQRLSATTQERLRERWKVSLCKRSQCDSPQSTTATVKKKKKNLQGCSGGRSRDEHFFDSDRNQKRSAVRAIIRYVSTVCVCVCVCLCCRGRLLAQGQQQVGWSIAAGSSLIVWNNWAAAEWRTNHALGLIQAFLPSRPPLCFVGVGVRSRPCFVNFVDKTSREHINSALAVGGLQCCLIVGKSIKEPSVVCSQVSSTASWALPVF